MKRNQTGRFFLLALCAALCLGMAALAADKSAAPAAPAAPVAAASAAATENEIPLYYNNFEAGSGVKSDIAISVSNANHFQTLPLAAWDGTCTVSEFTIGLDGTLTMPEKGEMMIWSQPYYQATDDTLGACIKDNDKAKSKSSADATKLEVNGKPAVLQPYSEKLCSTLAVNKGDVVRFLQPGQYRGRYNLPIANTPEAQFYFTVAATAPAAPGASAVMNQSPVLIDGAQTPFQAYTIDGNNYFKLRDVASALRGSQRQFEVTWDDEREAIQIVTGKPYTAVGGEMAAAQAGGTKTAARNQAPVYLDGKPMELTAYTIDGNNYFKLRDLGAALGFNVSWDEANGAIVVNTAQAYTAD